MRWRSFTRGGIIEGKEVLEARFLIPEEEIMDRDLIVKTKLMRDP